jgi:hypothetical protein
MSASPSVGPIWSFLMLATFSIGGAGLPLGIPPAPEDPLLAKIAPEDCLFYISWAGMGTPDAASKNQTEQLLAEPELQQFAAMIEKAIGASLIKKAGEHEDRQAVMAEIPKLFKALATKPTAAFVGDIAMGERGPTIEAGLIVSTGDDTARLMTSVATFEKLYGEAVEVELAGQKWKQLQTRPSAPPIVWGFKGRYFIIGVGEGTVEKIVERARGEAPKWLAAVREQCKVPRPSSIAYANIAKLASLPAKIGAPAQVTAVVKAMGLANVKHVVSVTGLDEQGCLTRTHVAIDGEAEGFFKLVTGKPLTADDLAPIPADATLAVALRLDPAKVFEAIEGFVAAAEPRGLAEFQSGAKEARSVLASVGDTWRIYNAPSEGGLIATGLTAVVDVRDREKLQAALVKLVEMTNAQGERFEKSIAEGGIAPNFVPTVREFEYNGQKVQYINLRSYGGAAFISPAWCLTEKELVVSLFPAQVKCYLSRKRDGNSLASVPEVAAMLKSEDPPTMLAYQDTKEFFKLAYPAAQVFANFLVGEFQHQNEELDMAAFPSAAAILPHLQPSTSMLSPTKDGLEMTTRQTLPMAFGVWQALPAAILASYDSHNSAQQRALERERFRGEFAPDIELE